MPIHYDEGKAALEALIEWAEAHADDRRRNEATTRLHLIDHLIENVLGWPKAQISAEEPAGAGRIDYSIGSPVVQLIIEAKREGVYFDLPAGTRTVFPVSPMARRARNSERRWSRSPDMLRPTA